MKKIIEYFRLLYKRFMSRTPKYFKKMIIFGLLLTGLGSTASEFADGLPEGLQKAGKYCAIIGATISVVAKFTTDNRDLSDESEDLMNKKA